MTYTRAVLLIAGLFTLSSARAACTGAGLTNPLFALNGTTWAFQTQDAYNDDAVGLFTLTVQPPTAKNPNPTGVLSGTETTVSVNGQVQRLIPFTGSYQVGADCASGFLFFKNTSTNYQYAFLNTGSELLLVNAGANMPNYSNGQYAGSHGKAELLAGPPQCPAGVSPNNLFTGNWIFETHDNSANSEIGTFTASVSGTGRTSLTGVLTSSEGNGVILTQFPFNGSFQVYGDCSGGNWVHSTTTPIFEFVFAGPGKMLYIDTSTTQGYLGKAQMVP